MPVRDATPDDLETILSLLRALADYERMTDEVTLDDAEFGRWLFGDPPAGYVLLAIDKADDNDGGDKQEPVGMALWYPTFSTFLGRPGIWLEDLFVRPEFRGRGHGLALLQTLGALSPGRVEWSVLDWNKPSIDFYEALGARPVDGWTRYRWLPGEAAP